MNVIKILGIAEGAGGLFDFNGTLPLMVIQFLLLTVTLTFVFYKPVAKVIDQREVDIKLTLQTASEKLIKAEQLYKEYDGQLQEARLTAQANITKSEKEAQEIAALEINKIRQSEAQVLASTTKKLENEEFLTFTNLCEDIDELIELVKRKLFGSVFPKYTSFSMFTKESNVNP